MKKSILLLLALVAITACIKKDEMANKNGFIVNVACSRGCNQFLLRVDSVLYYPTNLDKRFEQDKLAITVSGSILNSTKEVLKPSPADAPVHDFNAPEFKIKSISVR